MTVDELKSRDNSFSYDDEDMLWLKDNMENLRDGDGLFPSGGRLYFADTVNGPVALVMRDDMPQCAINASNVDNMVLAYMDWCIDHQQMFVPQDEVAVPIRYHGPYRQKGEGYDPIKDEALRPRDHQHYLTGVKFSDGVRLYRFDNPAGTPMSALYRGCNEFWSHNRDMEHQMLAAYGERVLRVKARNDQREAEQYNR